MKKLDTPCGEGCAAIIMEKNEITTISHMLRMEAIFKELESDYAKRLEKEFNQAVGLVKTTPEKNPAIELEVPEY